MSKILTMIEAPYFLLDVFTTRQFAGNQLAVFPESRFGPALMQQIAREMNLSESVFITRSAQPVLADLRIFTPTRELPFAGHPTIGAAIVLADVLRWVPRDTTSFVVREPIGDVPVSIERGERTTAWLTTPPVAFGGTRSHADAARLVQLDSALLDPQLPPELAGAGSRLIYVALRDRAAVDSAAVDVAVLRELGLADIVGVYVFAQTEEGAYARMFAPLSGIPEDPATGGGTGPLYAYLARHGRLERRSRFTNQQGVAMGRPSVLHVRLTWSDAKPSAIEVGGNAVVVGRGTLELPDELAS